MLKSNSVLRSFIRLKHKNPNHWAVLRRKKFPKDRALDNFDDFYGNVYGIRWKSMRIAMLCEKKYMALVNTFGDSEETVKMLESGGAINVRSIHDVARENVNLEDQIELGRVSMEPKIRQVAEREEENSIVSMYKNIKKQKDEEAASMVDPKKSLERTLAEDSNLQLDRMVSADNSGALFEFVPTTKLKGMEEYVSESKYYSYYKEEVDFPVEYTKDTSIHFPENLNMYTYEEGNVSTFKPPKRGSSGVFSHYLLDGASLLPPLVLDVKPGDSVLDACAAPGGKSLIMLQTLYPERLVCNELYESRHLRLRRIMKDFLYDFENTWDNRRVFTSKSDILDIHEFESYDRVLVDVPCTTDRHVLNANENNLFKPTRMKERLQLPEVQAQILARCLRLLKPGGTLVYSTCSLSPVQNDGVVHMALSSVFKDFGISAKIHDTSVVTQLFKDVFKFEHPKGLKYGQMVVPFLPANFGPMYFSKLTRK